MENPVQIRGLVPDSEDKCKCSRCKKIYKKTNFYKYKDGTYCEMCKLCLTAHVDNFDPSTFVWILEKLDVPYIVPQWNVLRDRAFAANPNKMTGMTVLGKYLAKMRLKNFKDYHYSDTERIAKELEEQEEAEKQAREEEKQKYQAELKVKLSEGKITLAEYQTLVSTETQNEETDWSNQGNVITGQRPKGNPTSYEQALSQAKNPFQQDNFIPEDELMDPGEKLDKEDRLYLAMKWGRLYKPSQWVALEQLYNEFMQSFDIQGAARIDTLKMICKTSLKMNEAIDMGDIDTYQKLSRVYDSMMKAAKFTQAQNKENGGDQLNSASAIVEFVEQKSGQIPRYQCYEPLDIVDKIIADLKQYNKNLIYEDKSLAQEIEKYLQDKRNVDEIKKDKKQAKERQQDVFYLNDEDFQNYNQAITVMKQHDDALDEDIIEDQYYKRRLQRV